MLRSRWLAMRGKERSSRYHRWHGESGPLPAVAAAAVSQQVPSDGAAALHNNRCRGNRCCGWLPSRQSECGALSSAAETPGAKASSLRVPTS